MDAWKDLGDRVRALAGNWAAYTAMGAFVLYVLGYLALRFHLTGLGVGTDLAVLDERYLFTGARFLVFLVSAVPIVVLVALVLAAAGYAPYRLALAVLPAAIGKKIRQSLRSLRAKLAAVLGGPARIALIGIVVSVIMIQTVMRQCLGFSNLLVKEAIGPPAWLHPLLLGQSTGLWAFYFPGLLAGTAAIAALYVLARAQPEQTTGSRALAGLLGLLVAVQVLLLPINYGYLFLDKALPRVASLGNGQALAPGETAWLVWEGQAGVTYLVDGGRSGSVERRLVTIPRKDISRTEITGYDQIFEALFDRREASAPAASGEGQKQEKRSGS